MANIKNRVKTIRPAVKRSKRGKRTAKSDKKPSKVATVQTGFSKSTIKPKKKVKKDLKNSNESKPKVVNEEKRTSQRIRKTKENLDLTNDVIDTKEKLLKEKILKLKKSKKEWNDSELFENFVYVENNGVRKINVPPMPDMGEGIFQCDHCKKTFKYKSRIIRHMQSHLVEDFTCFQCGMSFKKINQLINHQLNHGGLLSAPQLFICDHCGKPFLRKLQLRVHLATHAPAQSFKCAECPTIASTKQSLSQHMYNHRRKNCFQCSLCNHRYTNKTRLVFHIKSHLGIKDYVCYICGKRFSRPDAHKKHITSIHYELKQYECPICKKKLKGHLREHMRTHENLKPHICSHCGKTFAQHTQLKVHNRTHMGQRPYPCRVCDKAFTHSNALTLHIRRHTGERPIACALCPLRFSQLPHMKAHMKKIHNRDAAYKCNNCYEFFQFKSDLDKHKAVCNLNIKQELDGIQDVDTPMALSKMRFLLAVLLKNIADDRRLKVLGFNKRLIDDLLVDALISTNQTPCTDEGLTPAKRLRSNIKLFLDWTVPVRIMERFRSENKSVEELLEDLTSTVQV